MAAARCGWGVDKIMQHGLRALEGLGIRLFPGEEATEKARSIKGADEIRAMRCAIHACEAAMAEMERFARAEVPRGDVSEDDIWAVLHAENIRRGGEWIETRLLTSGPRTNPWFQECGGRIVQENEILAFDTDLVGAYGLLHRHQPDLVDRPGAATARTWSTRCATGSTTSEATWTCWGRACRSRI